MGKFKDNIKNIAKKKAQEYIEKKFKMKLIKIKIIIFLILAIFLVGFVYVMKLFDGIVKDDDMSNVPYAVSTYKTNVKFDENGITFNKTIQELWDEMIKEGSDIEQYLDKPEELEKLMYSEFITQYPRLDNDVEVNGTIDFVRHDGDNNSYKLKYISLEKFNNLVDTNNEDAVNYYTLDEDENFLFAMVNKTTEIVSSNYPDMDVSNYANILTNNDKKENGEYSKTEISVVKKSVPYKNVVSKYTMPFQYLWALLVITDDKDFVLDLVDKLVEKSEITISIYDNVTIDKNIDKYTYQQRKETYDENNELEYIVEDYTMTCTTIYENNNPTVDLTKADVWIIDYSKGEYTYKSETETVADNSKDLEDVHEGNVSKINRKEETKTINTSKSYASGDTTSNMKVNKLDGQDNFVTILCSAEHIGAKKLLVSGAEWLFEILERNEDTSNMVDLTKYLLYMATGKDYGVTEYDYNEYNPSDMNEVGNGSGGVSYKSLNLTNEDIEILYKITSAERGDGTQQQQEYVVSVILNRVLSSKFPNTVHGVVFAPIQFEPTRNGAYDAAVPSQTTKNAVDNVVKTGDKAQCAVYFMTPAAARGQSWLKNCIYLFNDESEKYKNTNTNGTHNFYTTEDVRNELKQYQEASGSSSVVESAVKIHKKVRESGAYRYNMEFSKKVPVNPPYIDCSSYVSWVLCDIGVKGFSSGMSQWTSVTFKNNPQGWQEVSVNDAQPGDILVYNGHVEIVAANTSGNKFKVYNMGTDSSIGASGTSELPESSTSGHSKSQIIKILRIP